MSVCLFTAFVIRHATRISSSPQFTVIYGLSGATIFFTHHLINGTIFGKKVMENKICTLSFCTPFV